MIKEMKKQAIIRSVLILLAYTIYALSMAQTRPYINSIDPTSASVGETITISGSGFPTSNANLVVSFGGVKGEVISTAANLIQVKVPAGAQYDELLVTDISTGLAASSREAFKLSYGGVTFNGLTSTQFRSNFDVVKEFATGATTNLVQPYDLCLCDFDGDGLQDVVITSKQNGPSSTKSRRVVFRNTSTVTTTSFVIDEELRNQGSTNAYCKDLDGDGKPELVVTEVVDLSSNESGSEKVEIYHNTSVLGDIRFSSTILFKTIPQDNNGNNRNPTMVEIADIDLDGKNDIIVSNEDRTTKTLDIFLNTSTIGNLSFAESNTTVALPNSNNYSREFGIADLNQDGLPDVVLVETEGQNFYYRQNESTAGNIQFKDPVIVAATGVNNIQNVQVADLNGDDFPEIIIADGGAGQTSELIIVKNATGTPGNTISFDEVARVNTSQGPYGISAGDLDGDGDLDLAVGVVTSGLKLVDVFINGSTSSAFSFSQVTLPVDDNNSKSVKIADINGDSKPDILAVTNSIFSTQGNLSVFTNRNCVKPRLEPSSDKFCPGNSLVVTATPLSQVTYQFEISSNNGPWTVKQTGTSNSYDIQGETTDFRLRVQVISNDGKCAVYSDEATFALNTETPNNPAITLTKTNFCEGETIQLSASVSADSYEWSGPNDFSSTLASPTVPSATAANAGVYQLRVRKNGGCLSSVATATVNILSIPEPNFTNTGNDAFCQGSSVVLQTTDFPGFSRSWNRDGTALNQTNSSLTVTQSGNYTLTLIDTDNPTCRKTSDGLLLSSVAAPVPTITGNDEICTDVQLDLSSSLTGSAQYGFTYSWQITDANSAVVASGTSESISNTFTSAGTYTATLTAGYEDIASCTQNVTKTLTATAPSPIPITAAATEKCASDSVLLEMPADLVSYNWSTGDTDRDAYAKTASGESATTVSVTVETSIGCTITSEATVTNYTDGGISITSPNLTIVDGVMTVPAGTLSILLAAVGGTDYQWSPAEIFSDPNAAEVTVRPRSVTTSIVLEGIDINNCEETDSLELINDNVQARKSFSPNGDELGFECWEILNSSTLDGCTLYILDKRGRTIYQGNSPFESDCAWNGIDVDGKPAPEGVYYFVFECADSELNRTGSIMLGR